ncbi:MAG TPA: cytochrome c [Nitrospiraceae bacterium]|nr:cytochrome c [Nitrospiraceae bacterium]
MLASVFILLLFSLLAVTNQPAWADSALLRPFWTEQAMFRFGDEVYFVGVASCAATAEDARLRAFDAGMKELNAYAQGRDTSRLLIETAMVYEEPDAPGCPKGTTSAWRLLRINQAKVAALPKRQTIPERSRKAPTSEQEESKPSEAAPIAPPPAPPLIQDLSPHAGMSRDEIAQRFGQPKTIKKRGQEEIWTYSDTGLTISFSPDETLISWTVTGRRDAEQRRHAETPKSPEPARPAEPTKQAEPTGQPGEPRAAERSQPESPQSEPVQQALALPVIPLARDPVAEGRTLFNGKGACNTCHGRDADMFTDVRREDLFGVPPGYQPFPFTPFAGPSPRRLPPNLRDWFALRIRTDLELARAIKDGIAGSTMTGARHLSDREIADLIAYLNSLR